MAQSIDIYKFLELSKNAPILDVRSPIEFESGHIPSACNMPLFTNEEHTAIGIIYKQKGKDLAMEKGYEYVEPKLSDFVKQAQKLAVGEEV
jgi:tRNA 2-selenouridine synthase